MLKKGILSSIALVVILGFNYPAGAVTWNVEPVTTAPEDDWFPFITVDNMNKLHVCYNHVDPDQEVFYTTNASGSWQSSRVTDNTVDDWSNTIIVDPMGQIHISIHGFDGVDQEVYHASGMPGSWGIERVTDDAKDDWYPQMAMDAQGFLHMAYYKVDPSGTDFEIFYANNRAGHWVQEQVTFNGWDDGVPSLALDHAGNPHIAYWSGIFPNYEVDYARKVAGVWDVQPVAPPQTWLPSLALDKNDFAHVAYAKWDGADWEIYYANNVTGSWQESQVTSNSTDDAWNSMVLDSEGKVHIAYLGNDGDNEIYYADNAAGVWQISRVTDNTVAEGFWGGKEFVIDGQGFGHIVFWNTLSGNSDVYHARSATPIAAAVAEEPKKSLARELILKPNSPEPFSHATRISFELPKAGPVSVNIYDVAGQLVRSLVNEHKPAGSFVLTWDGKSTEGNSLPGGIYFCQLRFGDTMLSEKLVLCR
jgi:hypothetical protein